MSSILEIIIIVVFIGLCPLIGKLIYEMKNSQALLFYGMISLGLTIILFFITDQPSWDDLKLIFAEYGDQLSESPGIYIISMITYLFAGIGIIGGTLEFAGEHIETEDTYKQLKILSRFKLVFLFLIYGYVFLFAVFAFSQFLTEIFQWEYPEQTSLIGNVVGLTQFRSVGIIFVGCLFFIIKSFRYGLLSPEFYRSEFHPSVSGIRWERREFRRIIACIFGPIVLYFSVFAYFLEKTPPSGFESFSLGHAIFFFAASIQAILFYVLKHKFVDQLKPLDKQYSLKVGSTALDFPEPDREDIKEADVDLKYDD